MAPIIQFKIQTGNERRTVSVDDLPVIIGRSREADITLDDDLVSRKHCRFEAYQGKVRVIDLESRNGTRVNGEFRNQYVLEDGDKVEVGDSTLVCEFDDSGNGRSKKEGVMPGDRGRTKRSTTRKATGSSRSSRLGVLLGTLFVFILLAGAVFLLIDFDTPRETASRQAFEEGQQLMEQEAYEDAIEHLRQVNQATPELRDRANELLEEAQNKRQDRQVADKIEQAKTHIREESRRIFNQLRNWELSLEEARQEFENIRHHLGDVFTRQERDRDDVTALWTLAKNYEEQVLSGRLPDELVQNERGTNRFNPEEVPETKQQRTGPETQFETPAGEELSNRVDNLLTEEAYAEAAAAIEQFRLENPAEEDLQRANDLMERVREQARGYLAQSRRRAGRRDRNGNTEEAVQMMKEVVEAFSLDGEGSNPLQDLHLQATNLLEEFQHKLD